MNEVIATRSKSHFDSAELADQLLGRHPDLRTKIAASLKCPGKDVKDALREVLRFLFLAANHKSGQLTPSHRVDLAWHELILFTRAYQEFCESHFGRFIHHSPGGSKESHREQFAATLRSYREYFGRPDAFFWGPAEPDEEGCGACESFGRID